MFYFLHIITGSTGKRKIIVIGKCMPGSLKENMEGMYGHCSKCKDDFINSEYDQEIQQSQTIDNSMALRGRATQPS